jgi:hypothetical protein
LCSPECREARCRPCVAASWLSGGSQQRWTEEGGYRGLQRIMVQQRPGLSQSRAHTEVWGDWAGATLRDVRGEDGHLLLSHAVLYELRFISLVDGCHVSVGRVVMHRNTRSATLHSRVPENYRWRRTYSKDAGAHSSSGQSPHIAVGYGQLSDVALSIPQTFPGSQTTG